MHVIDYIIIFKYKMNNEEVGGLGFKNKAIFLGLG
jgi:hypothetical protein